MSELPIRNTRGGNVGLNFSIGEFMIGLGLGMLIIISVYYDDITRIDYTTELSYQDGINDALHNIESCEMRFPEHNTSSKRGINGLYHHPKYFCVWTHEREANEIAETTFHELTHYYNYNEREHFKKDFED